MVVKRGDAWPIAMKVAQDWGFSVAAIQAYRVKGPRCQIRHRVAFEGENIYTQHPPRRTFYPPRRTLMDVRGQSCCALFHFVDILASLGVETKQAIKAIRPDSDPEWGSAPPIKRSVFPPGSDLMAFLFPK